MDEHEDVEIIAVFLHGVLALGHAVGILHNLRRRNYKAVLFHACAFLGDCYAVYIHWKDIHERRTKPR